MTRYYIIHSDMKSSLFFSFSSICTWLFARKLSVSFLMNCINVTPIVKLKEKQMCDFDTTMTAITWMMNSLNRERRKKWNQRRWRKKEIYKEKRKRTKPIVIDEERKYKKKKGHIKKSKNKRPWKRQNRFNLTSMVPWSQMKNTWIRGTVTWTTILSFLLSHCLFVFFAWLLSLSLCILVILQREKKRRKEHAAPLAASASDTWRMERERKREEKKVRHFYTCSAHCASLIVTQRLRCKHTHTHTQVVIEMMRII